MNLCFKHKHEWFPAQVTGVYDDDTIDTNTKENLRNGYYYEGLLITPERLGRCGFSKNSICWYIKFEREYDEVYNAIWIKKLIGDPERMYYFGVDIAGRSVALNNVYYIHQIQNIIYHIAKMELVYKSE